MKLFYTALIASCLSSVAFAKAPPKSQALVDKGKQLFMTYCVSCHGEKGDGEGPAGKFLNPKPRDYAHGKFKNGSSVEAIFKTLEQGIPGSAMVSFKASLPKDEDRWALAYYVRTFVESGAKAKK